MPDEANEQQSPFDERQAALERVLGKADDGVLHAGLPFQFGGQADVLSFRHHARIPGRVFTTCELLGEPTQKQNDLGTYELMVAQRDDHDWGPATISHLARYTCEAKIGLGHTMDLGNNFPAGSTMAGLLFAAYVRFKFREQKAGLLLCLPITRDEMQACKAGGKARVFEAMKAAGVHPYADLFRPSVLSPQAGGGA